MPISGGSSSASGGSFFTATAVIDEPFSSALSGVTADSGSSLTGLTVTGGVLGSSDPNNHQFHHSTVTVTDAKHIVKVDNITSATDHTVGVILKWIDSNNSLFMQAIAGTLNLYTVVAGAVTAVGAMSYALAAASSPLWLVARVSGNVIHVETWTVDPRNRPALPRENGSAPPIGSGCWQRFALTGGAATALGKNVAGSPGLRLTGDGGTGATPVTLDDWVVAVPTAAGRAEF